MNMTHPPLPAAPDAASARTAETRQHPARSVGKFTRFQTSFLRGALLCTTMALASSAQATWNGAGVSTGTGSTDISNPVNWNGGIIDGDFRTINQTSGTLALTMSGPFAPSGAINFAAPQFVNTTAVTVSSGGTGYTATPIAAFAGGTGTNVAATVNRNTTTNVVTGLTFTNNGSGYLGAALPTISFSGGGTGASGAAANFTGALPTGSVAISVSSDTPGVGRTITLGGNIAPQGRSDSSLTFSPDVTIDLGAGTVTRTINSVPTANGVLNQGTPITINGPITSTATGLQALALGAATTAGSVTLNGTVNVDGGLQHPSSSTDTVNGKLSGGGVSSNSGSLVLLNSANDFTGTIAANSFSGLLAIQFSSNAALGNLSNPITINSGSGASGITYVGTSNETISRSITTSGSGSGTNAATIQNNSSNNSALTISGTITNGSILGLAGTSTGANEVTSAITSGGITKYGTGTWAVSGANSQSGTANLSGGLLNIKSVTALGTGSFSVGGNGSFDNITGSPLTLTNSAFNLVGGSPTFVGTSDLTINAPVTINTTRTITVTNPSATLTLGGAIGQDATTARNFAKAGPGTLLLNGTNTYTGTTTVSGGRLGGVGSLTSATTFNSNTTHVPGAAANTTGIQTITGNYTLSGGSTLQVQINDATAGSGYDQVSVSGTVTLATGTPLTGANLSVTTPGTAPSGTFTLINNTGTGAIVGTFSGLPEGATFSTGGSTFQISYIGGTGNDVVLTNIGAAPASGGVVISEFRFRGPSGLDDEYVEIANTTGNAIDISNYVVRTNTGTATAPSFQLTPALPAGTTLPPYGRFLFTGANYSLDAYSNFGSNATTNPAQVEVSLGADVPDDSGVALLSGTTVVDAVGFATSAASQRENGVLASAPNTNGTLSNQYAFMRDFVGQFLKDTGSSTSDFVLVSTTGASVAGTNGAIAAQLGAPNPESLSSPTLANTLISTRLLDLSQNQNSAPNRVRTGTGSAGNLLIRRTLRNNSTQAISRLRMQVTRITGQNSPFITAGQADVRLIGQPTETGVPIGTGASATTVTVFGTALEAPSNTTTTSGSAPNTVVSSGGGGLGSSLSFDLVLATPLQPNDEKSYAFNLQVARSGNFVVVFNILANTQPATPPGQ